MIRFHHINGSLCAADSASLRVTDLAILRGFGIFDFFTVIDGKPVFIDDYLQRFYHSAEHLGLTVPVTKEKCREQIFELISANGQRDAGIRLLLTGGSATDGYTPVQPNLLILQHPFPTIPEEKYQTGVKLITHRHQRELPGIKTINYLTGIWLREKLAKAGALEPLYHDGEYISESVRSNFFAIMDGGKVVTPDRGILMGVTRKHLLKIIPQYGELIERPLKLAELGKVREAFLTSSTKGVLPVVMIDEMPIGPGVPGEMSLTLQQAFIEYRRAYLEGARAAL